MSLLDEALLSNDPIFVQRVRTAMINAAISISNESTTTAFHTQRDALAVQALNSPDGLKSTFAASVATISTVINDATQNGTVTLTSTNSAQQAALVLDADINAAVSTVWNSFFQH